MTSPLVFLTEVRTELEKVSWPTRAQVTKMTVIVVSVSALVALFVGGLDFVFTKLMEFSITLKYNG
jgi:preprotein translocase subunit SecE